MPRACSPCPGTTSPSACPLILQSEPPGPLRVVLILICPRFLCLFKSCLSSHPHCLLGRSGKLSSMWTRRAGRCPWGADLHQEEFQRSPLSSFCWDQLPVPCLSPPCQDS